MKYWLVFVGFLFVLSSVSAASVGGFLYNIGFDPIEDALVEVDSTPVQSVVSKDGSYSFELNPGTYTITAKSYEDFVLDSVGEETVTIVDDGDYAVDIILLPTLNGEDLFNLSEIEDFEEEKEFNYLWLVVVALGVVILLLVFWKKMFRKGAKPGEVVEDEEVKRVLEYIKKEGRITQKEMRKALNLSESRASLILAELEHMKKIKRFKKGRGNIVVKR